MHLKSLKQIRKTTTCNRFEKLPFEGQDFREKITDPFRGICGMYLKLMERNQKTTTCNRLDLETLGFRPIMPKSLPGHCRLIGRQLDICKGKFMNREG